MKKVLFISSRPIYPIVGGDQIRTAQQLELLTKKFRVDVVFLTPYKENNSVKDYSPEINDEFRFYVPKYKSYFNTLRFIFNKLPMQVNYYYDNTVKRFIDRNIGNYDVVFCNNIRTAEYVRHHSVIKYLDFVDAISMNYDKARKHAKGLKKLIFSIDFRRCRNYELKCLGDFSSCSIISDVDNKYITKCQEESTQ
ncbi:MAG: hypothetical protein NC453_12915 [Muribaculum sp.]|nr:hypothetical protein [Muribaculum sp.]